MGYNKNSNVGFSCSEPWAHEHTAQHPPAFLTLCFASDYSWCCVVITPWAIDGPFLAEALRIPTKCKFCKSRAISVLLPPQFLPECLAKIKNSINIY